MFAKQITSFTLRKGRCLQLYFSYLSDPVTCDDAVTASLSLFTVKCQTLHGCNDVFNLYPVRRGKRVVSVIRDFVSEAGCENKTASALEWTAARAATRSSWRLAVEQCLDVIIQSVH